MDPTPPVRTRSAIVAGIVAWAVSISLILVLGLGTGVWELSDVTPLGVVITEFGVSSLFTIVLISAPVALYFRYGLITPVLILVLYFGFWIFTGFDIGEPVRGLFIALVYSAWTVPMYIVVSILEYIFRVRTIHPPSTNA